MFLFFNYIINNCAFLYHHDFDTNSLSNFKNLTSFTLIYIYISLVFQALIACVCVYLERIEMLEKRRQRLIILIVGMALWLFWVSLKLNKRHINETMTFRKERNATSIYNSDLQNQKVKRILKILHWSSRKIDPSVLKQTVLASVKYRCELEYGTDCVFVSERSEYNESDAVIISIYATHLTDYPAYRPPGQRWIAYLHESPQIMPTGKMDAGWRNLFTASMSYMLNADIPILFPRYTSGNHSKWNSDQLEKIRRNIRVKVKQKTKMVAWFVSNCKTPSDRETHVRELSKYIKVDVIGKCGNLTCHKKIGDKYGKCGNVTCPRSIEGEYGECDTMLDKHYKFYLAFENSLCEEYVTEKFNRMVNRDVIPVVLGGADYSAFTAPETYLDVRNFTSPRRLAEFMKYLDKRTDIYVDYLMRKRSMVHQQRNALQCELCNYLHKNLHSNQRIQLDQV